MQKMRIHRTLLALSTAISAATACVSASQNHQPPIVPQAGAATATVTVHNEQLADMRVYIMNGSAEYRLGTVPAMSSATFKVPRVIPSPSDLRFVTASLTGDESRSSESVSVSAGSAVEFTIGQPRMLSSLFVRR